MQIRVRKWGNSASVRIPASLMESVHLKLDDAVDMREEDGRIVITPILHREEVLLEDLLEAIAPENLHGETDSGPPVGREAL
ncbi:MAG: AbrB/MazE/SpoVT family DNA-binding domain-containing protein [Gammaproteobacteria bacterium]|nr:AbrB/MazE/SpoVT family DNA-binding domain-containing protein [Gammaproteobacteria bacterium]